MIKNKWGENSEFFYCNFFPKNKRGQFFLVMSIVIIGLVAGLTGITNSLQKQSDAKFYRVSEELKFESEKVIDYGIGQGFDETGMKSLLTNFSNNYSSYSNADDFYYIFGTTSEITFAGLRKKSGGTVQINFGSGNQGITLSQNSFTTPASYTPSGTNVDLTIDGVTYPFTLHEGQNFFFVVSKNIEGDVYTATNG